MSVAKHMEAMEVWGRLSRMSPEDAKAKAKDEESEVNYHPLKKVACN